MEIVFICCDEPFPVLHYNIWMFYKLLYTGEKKTIWLFKSNNKDAKGNPGNLHSVGLSEGTQYFVHDSAQWVFSYQSHLLKHFTVVYGQLTFSGDLFVALNKRSSESGLSLEPDHRWTNAHYQHKGPISQRTGNNSGPHKERQIPISLKHFVMWTVSTLIK